ncbi:hypothetical protein ACGTJS_00545 [Faucicola mancuniensis]|uniref:hypothetical protein n=1 Tax=Faucicola mancuniensis TaxID=1309795 RepID=UPI00397783CC
MSLSKREQVALQLLSTLLTQNKPNAMAEAFALADEFLMVSDQTNPNLQPTLPKNEQNPATSTTPKKFQIISPVTGK